MPWNEKGPYKLRNINHKKVGQRIVIFSWEVKQHGFGKRAQKEGKRVNSLELRAIIPVPYSTWLLAPTFLHTSEGGNCQPSCLISVLDQGLAAF